MHLEKGVKTRPSQIREEIKLSERSEFLILASFDQVLAIFQPALDLFSVPFFYQEKTRNISLVRKEVIRGKPLEKSSKGKRVSPQFVCRQNTVHLEKGVKTRPSQNREEIKLFERSEFLVLVSFDQVLAILQPALDLFSIPFFYQEKTRNKPLVRKEVEGKKRKK